MSLAACNSMERAKKNILHPFHSPQELIVKRGINQPDGKAKEYVYLWDQKQHSNSTQAMYPRSIVTQYCHEQGGKLSLLYKSKFSLVGDSAQRTRLAANRGVVQGVGAYKCTMDDLAESWIVSIEPVSERQPEKNSKTRNVRLLTRLMETAEAHNFYRAAASTPNPAKKQLNVAKATVTPIAKTTVAAKPATELKDHDRKEQDRKELERKELAKVEAEKKEQKPVTVATPRATVVETPQQQQMKLYVAARRDINNGKNLNNACNNAQRAYNYGKQHGTEGTRVYTESGMLVARCLTGISTYSSRFPNAKGQAQRVLSGLATQYNHAGAKNMLRQLN
ncbi:hypothetical protein BS636_01185 [Acinetobacter sp. LoGeW2-3]|uniref:hypothetical protein n=1 Tax=Acinetobacter sp. LoGeW2-3 TaxID=1808001 RepID=UPI000C059E56|nr:hypothetical protein [Acinetobacter sp. LoGeW2-3]ATO18382.1 hypothetical protein BS636_01185 [Acinetobacter sp. LoGeW2-3]